MSKDAVNLIPYRIFRRTNGLSELGFLIAFENPSGSLIMSWHLNTSRKKKIKSAPWFLAKFFVCLSWQRI